MNIPSSRNVTLKSHLSPNNNNTDIINPMSTNEEKVPSSLYQYRDISPDKIVILSAEGEDITNRPSRHITMTNSQHGSNGIINTPTKIKELYTSTFSHQPSELGYKSGDSSRKKHVYPQ